MYDNNLFPEKKQEKISTHIKKVLISDNYY